MDDAPSNEFFEYIARPQTAELFFEDVLMACVFYGMPILVENKASLALSLQESWISRILHESTDKTYNKLLKRERACESQLSEDVKQAHASAIESYIEKYVGIDMDGSFRDADEMGSMLFTRTLEDWAKFDITNRTKFDASISSGLAIMACQKHLYQP